MKERKNLYLSMVGWGLLLAGALSFSSCVDDELDNGLQTTGKNIGLNASYSRGTWEPDQTRSAKEKKSSIRCESSDGDFSVDVTVEDGIRSFQSEQVESRGIQIAQKGGWNYRVGAYYTTDKEATNLDSKTINFFTENTDGGISIASDADNFTTNYYWPPVGTMKFFAVAPADVTSLSIPSVNDINTPTITYTIPENVADQKDIMVAQTTADCPQTTAVGLQFQHLLAAVQFKVGAMQFIKINKLTISGIEGGNITMTYNNGIWSYRASKTTSYTPIYYTNETTKEPNIDTSGLPSGSDITGNENGLTMLMMPQEPGTNAKITVSYTNVITGEFFENKDASIAAVVDENGVKKGVWEAGKTTVYTLNIDSNIAVEIQSPSDADAHYVRVDMQYDLSGFSGLNGVQISDIKAQAYWLNDNSNTASDDKQAIYLKTGLTPKQSEGYFTDELWVVEYTVDEKNNVTYTVGSENGPEKVADILGAKEIELVNGSNGNIYLFLDENDGDTDRNGELIIKAKVTRDGTNDDVVLAKGRFKQLCPSRNENGLGIERFESNVSYSFGFNYNRKVIYTNKYAEMSAFEQFLNKLWALILSLFGITMDTILPDVEGQAEGFITIKYTNDYLDREVIHTITLDYTALNAVENITNSEDGLINTTNLYNYTGATDITTLESQLNESFGFNGTNTESNEWKRKIEPVGTPNPEYYAAYIALTCNRMREFVQYENGEEKVRKAILHKVGEGGTDKKGDESGLNIIEWYLPSSEEAVSLKETGTGEEDTPISPLNGTYWSSTAGSDENAYAHSYTFKNNNNPTINESAGRMTGYKVRAVRMKQQ